MCIYLHQGRHVLELGLHLHAEDGGRLVARGHDYRRDAGCRGRRDPQHDGDEPPCFGHGCVWAMELCLGVRRLEGAK